MAGYRSAQMRSSSSIRRGRCRRTLPPSKSSATLGAAAPRRVRPTGAAPQRPAQPPTPRSRAEGRSPRGEAARSAASAVVSLTLSARARVLASAAQPPRLPSARGPRAAATDVCVCHPDACRAGAASRAVPPRRRRVDERAAVAARAGWPRVPDPTATRQRRRPSGPSRREGAGGGGGGAALNGGAPSAAVKVTPFR